MRAEIDAFPHSSLLSQPVAVLHRWLVSTMVNERNRRIGSNVAGDGVGRAPGQDLVPDDHLPEIDDRSHHS
jgi:hypothetical protein